MSNIEFIHPEFFFLFLLLIPIALLWYRNKKKELISFKISNLKVFEGTQTKKNRWLPLLKIFRLLALSLMIVALARPQSSSEKVQVKISDGIDIVLSMDVSGSMLAKDFNPNRLEALKAVAQTFAKNRVNDRLGVVVYASEAYTKTPVTNDQVVIQDAIRSIQYSQMIKDGTAIGVGLGTAVNRLKNSIAKSKVVVLMTDGVNNAGLINPMMAAQMAKEYNIKVYTIGIGSNGMAETPVAIDENGKVIYKKVKVEIDEKLMQTIAKETGGKYFRATDKNKLEEIYNEIDELEKTKINETKYVQKTEWFRPFLLLALLLILVEFVCRKTIFKGIV